MPRTCTATTKSTGKKCTNSALPGKRKCGVHAKRPSKRVVSNGIFSGQSAINSSRARVRTAERLKNFKRAATASQGTGPLSRGALDIAGEIAKHLSPSSNNTIPPEDQVLKDLKIEFTIDDKAILSGLPGVLGSMWRGQPLTLKEDKSSKPRKEGAIVYSKEVVLRGVNGYNIDFPRVHGVYQFPDMSLSYKSAHASSGTNESNAYYGFTNDFDYGFYMTYSKNKTSMDIKPKYIYLSVVYNDASDYTDDDEIPQPTITYKVEQTGFDLFS